MKKIQLLVTFLMFPLFFYAQSSLVAYYPFNGNANDLSGNANNGTVNGATLTTDRFGVANSAYYFDGSSNYISITDNPNINIQTGESFTISYWCKYDAQNNATYLISKYKGSYGEPSYALGAGSGDLPYSWFEFTVGNGIENRGAIHLYDTNWHNITTVFKSGVSITIYVDGVLDISKSTTYTGSIINSRNLTIGSGSNIAQFYKGAIDDIKIYKKALSLQEIQNEINGLVAYYPFNGNANDESGSENNGTVHGATLTTDRFGIANSAYHFNGVDNDIQCLFPGPLGGADRTISFWAKTNVLLTTNYGNVVLSYGISPTSFDYGARFDISINSKARGLAVGLGGGELNKAFDNSDGNWHYYTVVFDNTIGANLTNILFYGDGNKLTTTAAFNGADNNIHTSNQYPIYIGMLYAYGRYFNGDIDEVKVYNKALTETEIKNDYKTLIAYYPFNGNANDESGNNLNGTVSGATLSSDRFGNSDSAYSFDGNDIITIAHDDILNCSNELSISVWVKPNSLQNAMILGKSNYTSNTNYLLRAKSTGYIQFEYKNFANSNSLPLIVNDWNHIVVVSNTDDSKQVYVNGVLATHTTVTSPYGLVTNDLTIGARYRAEFFNGSIDDLRIYKAALTESDVLALYNNNSLDIADNQLKQANTFYVSKNTLYFKNTQNLNDIKNIEIYNLLGQKVFTTSKIKRQIPITNLQKGMYILKVEDKNSNYNTLKFLSY
ncbi:LamG-like jellyroll fold domain-containing protein [Lutibacter sp.]|uniref:LamG-like jellyroll fold domain-containing protein n=1 Tax=Lutibacter sp. TaxID=1925666 RepID=UPI0025C73483|nr:LamG-like jellyroll fold domain-containing protein [Lutibacter sp.]MCF6180861.1 T9SS type A sorting domain-containing protein [Lutibacter sp.]